MWNKRSNVSKHEVREGKKTKESQGENGEDKKDNDEDKEMTERLLNRNSSESKMQAMEICKDIEHEKAHGLAVPLAQSQESQDLNSCQIKERQHVSTTSILTATTATAISTSRRQSQKLNELLESLCGPENVCLQCRKTFKQKAHLHRHIKEQHFANNPNHICAICNK
ncbi:hypothetical protein RFI_18344, partial [Reticulomyxa filosa]